MIIKFHQRIPLDEIHSMTVDDALITVEQFSKFLKWERGNGNV